MLGPLKRLLVGLSIMASAVFGNGTFMYFLLQASTAAILILAANTAFNAFPSMCWILARDRYLPTQLANRGDRLVYSNGIIILAIVAAVLVTAFDGKTTKLIPSRPSACSPTDTRP